LHHTVKKSLPLKFQNQIQRIITSMNRSNECFDRIAQTQFKKIKKINIGALNMVAQCTASATKQAAPKRTKARKRAFVSFSESQ